MPIYTVSSFLLQRPSHLHDSFSFSNSFRFPVDASAGGAFAPFTRSDSANGTYFRTLLEAPDRGTTVRSHSADHSQHCLRSHAAHGQTTSPVVSCPAEGWTRLARVQRTMHDWTGPWVIQRNALSTSTHPVQLPKAGTSEYPADVSSPCLSSWPHQCCRPAYMSSPSSLSSSAYQSSPPTDMLLLYLSPPTHQSGVTAGMSHPCLSRSPHQPCPTVDMPLPCLSHFQH